MSLTIRERPASAPPDYPPRERGVRIVVQPLSGRERSVDRLNAAHRQQEYVYLLRHDIPPLRQGSQSGFFNWIRSCFYRTEHPACQIKYAHTLQAVFAALVEKFPNWNTDFLQQLQVISQKSEFNGHVYAALSPFVSSQKDFRSRYEEIMHRVKLALKVAPSPPFDSDTVRQAREMLSYLCHAHFTKVHFSRFMEDCTLQCLRASPDASSGSYQIAHVTLQNLADEIQWAYSYLQRVPLEYRGNVSLSIPWVQSIQTVDEGQKCTILQHSGSICIDEYRAFLEAEPNAQTLYCSHKKGGIGRVKDLEKAFSNFHCMSLPMDGSLLSEQNMELWKRTISEWIAGEQEGFTLPDHRELKEAICREAPQILEGVHQHYFAGKELSDVPLKKAFLLLFYSKLQDFVKGKLRADYVIFQDGEGVVANAVDRVKNLVQLNLEHDSQLLHGVVISVVAPALVSGERILEEQLKAGLEAIGVLARLSGEEKRKLRESSSTNFSILREEIPTEESSWGEIVGQDRFIQMIEASKMHGEVRERIDPEFLTNQISDFCTGGRWKLTKLKTQIENDLHRHDIRVNGKRMLRFIDICELLELNETIFEQEDWEASDLKQRRAVEFMTVLHQGAVKEVFAYARGHLMPNRFDFHLVPRTLDDARKAILQLILEWVKGKSEEAIREIARGCLEQWPDEFRNYLRSAALDGFLPITLAPEDSSQEPLLPIFPTRLFASIQEGRFEFVGEQELSIRQVIDNETLEFPILAVTRWSEGAPASHSWQFVEKFLFAKLGKAVY